MTNATQNGKPYAGNPHVRFEVGGSRIGKPRRGSLLYKNTGFITIDPQSLVSVRVVQVTGAGDDVSKWATEVAGTERILVAEKQGEGTVKWRHVRPGVWKADLVIKVNDSETYRETRILDLRKYAGPGLMLFVK